MQEVKHMHLADTFKIGLGSISANFFTMRKCIDTVFQSGGFA